MEEDVKKDFHNENTNNTQESAPNTDDRDKGYEGNEALKKSESCTAADERSYSENFRRYLSLTRQTGS